MRSVCMGDDLGGRLYESREEREICMGGRLGLLGFSGGQVIV